MAGVEQKGGAGKKWGWSTESRHARGYGSAWDKIRKLALQRDNGMCHCRLCNGVKLVAHEVHHIKPKAKGGTDDLSNLMSINRYCHERETIEEQGGTQKARVAIGLDGYPVESPAPGVGSISGRFH